MKSAIVLLAATGFSCADAAEAYKCRDSTGRITYSSESCEKQGLQPAGRVRDRVMVVPAYKPPAAPARNPAKRGEDDAPRQGPATAVKPVNPLTEKLAK